MGEAEFDDVLPRIAPGSWYLAEHQIGNDISPAIIKIFDTRLRQAADQCGGFVPLPIKATIEPNDHVLHSFPRLRLVFGFEFFDHVIKVGPKSEHKTDTPQRR